MICTGERLPHQLLRNALKDTLSASSVAAPRECYEPENKRKCTEPGRQRMSDDLMELNDTELNYVYFKRYSDDASNKVNETLSYKKSFFK